MGNRRCPKDALNLQMPENLERVACFVGGLTGHQVLKRLLFLLDKNISPQPRPARIVASVVAHHYLLTTSLRWSFL